MQKVTKHTTPAAVPTQDSALTTASTPATVSGSVSISVPVPVSASMSKLLRTMLILDIVVLDKLHRKSAISLLLIHLRCLLDNVMDSISDTKVNDTKIVEDSLVIQFHDIMSQVFSHSDFYGLGELKSIYSQLLQDINIARQNGSIPSESQLQNYIDQMLCCSESMTIYKHLDGDLSNVSGAEEYENDCLRQHFSDSFSGRKPAVVVAAVTLENLQIVKSESFIQFHLKRWKALNLLDTHIFKR
jgi:hypothetical protein